MVMSCTGETKADDAMDAKPKERGRNASITVLEFGGCVVKKSAMCYTVTDVGNCNAKHSKRPTFHASIPAAIQEVSDRILGDRLAERNRAGLTDLTSLVSLIRNHNSAMAESLGVHCDQGE
jgi:hypothetical protein